MQEAISRKVETYVTREGKDVFQEWLTGLRDQRARALIDKAVAKIRLGNLAKHKAVGEGVQEIVLDYGPGYRIYFGEHGMTLIVLLLGSTKKSQQKAIEIAKRYWNDWKERTLK